MRSIFLSLKSPDTKAFNLSLLLSVKGDLESSANGITLLYKPRLIYFSIFIDFSLQVYTLKKVTYVVMKPDRGRMLKGRGVGSFIQGLYN